MLALGMLGCRERPRGEGSVTLQLASRHTSATPIGVAARGDEALVAIGPDSLIVRRVAVVLKELQLAPVGSGECDPDEDEEPCAPIAAGPVLMTLPLGNVAKPMITVGAPGERYIVFQFAIYTPDLSQDGAFLATHPEFTGISIRVEGSFSQSGRRGDFVYTSDFNEQEETGLLPPLTVQPGAPIGLTLRMDLATWFLTADKTALIDPSSANRGGPNQSLVHDNIRTSIAAFRDDDLDGLADGNAPAASPWPADHDANQLAALLTRGPARVPQCRQGLPRITQDSIGPFRLAASLAELQRACPQLLYGWDVDPDGFPVPAVATRLGATIITALLSDTLATAGVRQVDLERAGPKTAAGVGVGSTLQELQQAYGTPGASEPGCVLRVWFASLPGLAFRMAFPARERRACGALSEDPLPPDLRVAAVILVPR